jgi:hypothetical protein
MKGFVACRPVIKERLRKIFRLKGVRVSIWNVAIGPCVEALVHSW